jgi:hypothetical protein
MHVLDDLEGITDEDHLARHRHELAQDGKQKLHRPLGTLERE